MAEKVKIGHLDPEEELRKARRKAKEGLRRLDKNPKPPEAADEMWLLGGPEKAGQGGFQLASARRRSERRRRIAKVRTGVA